VHVKIWCR